ncbi:hypothetical protein [Deinococcus hohokamensis]|uniref:Uncharacterized protein n=1 Tax=Deinococcus hohokamensis TaxID=309883 RepID=A0ABV9I3X9_9DEIO
MEHDINPQPLGSAGLPDLSPPLPALPSSPLARVRNGLTVRPALAHALSDGLILLVVCLSGLGAVMGVQKLSSLQRPPLAGMAELHAQILSLPPDLSGPAKDRTTQSAQPPASSAAVTPRRLPAEAVNPEGPESTASAKSNGARVVADPQLARPITGAARVVVLRLTRAAGFVLPVAVLQRPTATTDVARMMATVGKTVPARTLVALQTAPEDPALIADLTEKLRGQGRVATTPPVPTGSAAVSSPTAARPTRPSRPEAPEGPLRVPNEIPMPALSAASAKPGHLETKLDDPLPVNWLQAMTEQAVTPLTPRN